MSQNVDELREQELLLLKQQQLNLMAEKLKLVKEFGLPFYRPHPKQDAFHRAGKFRRRMFRAGNRTGKSQAGVAEDCAHFLGERPWYDENDPARYEGIRQGRTKGLVITTDWDKVDEVFTGQGRGGDIGKFWRMLPAGYVIKTKKNHSGVIDYIEGKDGSTIRFDTVKSFIMNPMGSESSDFDWVHWDEPAPKAMHTAVNRGLMDRGGVEWFTLTPLSEPWINDLFFPNVQEAKRLDVVERIRKGRPFSWVISGSTYDNIYLSAEDIEEYEMSLSEEERQCRINGLPLSMSGLVYKEFNYDRHVLREIPHGWKDYNTPPRDWPIYLSIDPHPQTPHAVIFVAVSPFGQKFFFEELFIHCTIEDLVGYIDEKTRDRGYVIANPVKCDPMAWICDPITNTSIEQEFARCGLIVEKASKSKAHGILNMQAELQRDNNIFVSPNLTRFLYEISHYSYDKENKPVDKDDHLMEASYRLLLNEPRFFDVNETTPTAIESEPILDAMEGNWYEDALAGAYD